MSESPVKELRLALTSEDYVGALRFYRDVLGLPVLSGEVVVLEPGAEHGSAPGA